MKHGEDGFVLVSYSWGEKTETAKLIYEKKGRTYERTVYQPLTVRHFRN